MARGRKKGTVGVVGLGNMGGAYARHLAAAGWRVIGVDPDAKRRRALAKVGGEIAPDAIALAQAAPIIITSLPNPQALDATVAAITAKKSPPKIIVETSTFKLDDKMRAESALAKAGHTLLDCPVSGTGAQAAVKDIVIYASGDRKAIAKLKPMFADLSRGFFDVGAFGNGSKMKFIANLLVTIHNVAAAEAMVLGIKSGLDPQVIYDLVAAGAGTSRMFEVRGPMMVRNRYDNATMSIKLFHKDISVIEDFAVKLGVPTPLFSATIPIYSSAMALGHGEDDTGAVCAVLQEMAGVKRDKRTKKQRGARR